MDNWVVIPVIPNEGRPNQIVTENQLNGQC